MIPQLLFALPDPIANLAAIEGGKAWDRKFAPSLALLRHQGIDLTT
jgi:hypothetical protein